MLDWKEPLPLERVVDRGLAIFNDTLPRAFLLAVIAALATNLALHYGMAGRETEFQTLVKNGELRAIADRFGALLFGVSLLSLVLSSAVLYLVGTLARGAPVDTLSALVAALHAAPQVLVASLLYFLAVWCGLVLLLVPGVYLAVAFVFFMQAVLFDRCDGLRAPAASLRLVRGNWWLTFALCLLLVVVSLIASLVIQAAVGMVVTVTRALLDAERSALLELVLGSGFGAVVGLAFDGVLVAYYYDLTLRGGARRPEGSIAV